MNAMAKATGSTGMAAIEPTPELLEQVYAAIIDGDLPPEAGDPGITSRMILQRIKDGTLEESLGPSESLPQWPRDTDVTVLGFHLNSSSFKDEDGSVSSVYAVVELVHADGTLEMVQCGGSKVLVQLVKAWEQQAFPFQCRLEGTKTGQGYTTLCLREPGQAKAKGK